jgi:hypothetical protein
MKIQPTSAKRRIPFTSQSVATSWMCRCTRVSDAGWTALAEAAACIAAPTGAEPTDFPQELQNCAPGLI